MAKATSSPSVTGPRTSRPAVTAGSGASASTYQPVYGPVYGHTAAASAPLVTAASASSPGVS